MKKLLTLWLITVLFSQIVNAQISQETTRDKGLIKNDLLFEAYYGYAIPGVVLAEINGLSNAGWTNSAGYPYTSKTSVLGPIGLRMQYMVSDNLGIGLDVNFEQKSGSWESLNVQYDENGLIIYDESFKAILTNTEGEFQVWKLKVMARFSWELINTERFTLNWANSIGFKAGDRTLIDPAEDLFLAGEGDVFPIAIRSALGARFFFTENIALNTEAGLFGGGLLLAGLSYKL
jgi:hypothetical protein